ncbi:Not available [Clostridium perfringens]|nr:Not available [Clostridium perfringens]
MELLFILLFLIMLMTAFSTSLRETKK